MWIFSRMISTVNTRPWGFSSCEENTLMLGSVTDTNVKKGLHYILMCAAKFLSTRPKLRHTQEERISAEKLSASNWPMAMTCGEFSWLLINIGGLSPLWAVLSLAGGCGICKKGCWGWGPLVSSIPRWLLLQVPTLSSCLDISGWEIIKCKMK